MAQPASCYNFDKARAARTDGSASELCADNNQKNYISLTTTCERFVSGANLGGMGRTPLPRFVLT